MLISLIRQAPVVLLADYSLNAQWEHQMQHAKYMMVNHRKNLAIQTFFPGDKSMGCRKVGYPLHLPMPRIQNQHSKAEEENVQRGPHVLTCMHTIQRQCRNKNVLLLAVPLQIIGMEMYVNKILIILTI
jgi:hypothetical protein